MSTQPSPTAAQPLLILIIPQDALETMPTAIAVGIRGCEAAYAGGKYFVTIPSEVYNQWPKGEPTV